jgi:hypothetical protein
MISNSSQDVQAKRCGHNFPFDDCPFGYCESREAVQKLRSQLPSEPAEGTVRIELAIALDTFGEVHVGVVGQGVTKGEAVRSLLREMDDGAEFLAVAEIDLPRITTVQGRVVESGVKP